MEVLNGIDVIADDNSSQVTTSMAVNHTWYTETPPGGTTKIQRESIGTTQRVLVTMLISLLILFITLGNLATIVAVCVYKRLRSVSNLYLASLATADLLVGLPVMTLMLLYTVTLDGRWVFGDVICDVWTYLDFVSCTASLTNVCAIAGDRFITLAQPLKSIRKRTKKRVLKVILGVWLFPLLFWLGVIISLRVSNGRPADGTCYLIWKPDLLAIISVVMIVYLPLTIILVLFIAILCLLQHHMGSMNHRLRRSTSFKDSLQDDDDVTAERAGGISFNPRLSNPISESTTGGRGGTGNEGLIKPNIPLETIKGKSCLGLGNFVSTAVGTDANSICSDDEELYILKGRKFRTVGTSTSPERFGLVRTIGTNTSPSLQKKDVGCSSTSVPDVANVGHAQSSLGSTSIISASVSASVSTSAGTLIPSLAVELRSDESDTDTIKTFSTCSSSTSRESRTDESELSLVRLSTKLRRHYASLLRSERENSVERSRLKQQVKAARILGVIMGFLLICWLPFSILWPLRTFCPDCISQRLFEISIWTNYVNSAINPIIYCMYNPSFRRAYKKLFIQKCYCRCKRTYHE